ncbi:Morn repeat domain containing protein [Pandoravirus quercus]|uniref:Morn repeat domain containing protein n=1 Tax=Pandoravirus quercus TaxID=2107709 RepID=A0A2U7U9T9_9VIRU|nr:Morn repeat domain containing protein [Pandoravirus quercus]AVK75196.1 Morn repeat domain containing protein [Pandoravirus quercus]
MPRTANRRRFIAAYSMPRGGRALFCWRRRHCRSPKGWRWWRRMTESRHCERHSCASSHRRRHAAILLDDPTPPNDAFLVLPDELIVAIAVATRSASAICRIEATCRRMARICGDDSLWRHLYTLCYGDPLHRQFSNYGKDWRWLYRAVASAPAVPAATGPHRSVRESVVFMGDLVNGEPHGYGLAVEMADEAAAACKTDQILNRHGVLSTFEGTWVGGREHGHGVEEIAGQGVYTGAWVAGARDGHGACAWAGGERYTGEWRAGKKHGAGTYTWSNGDRYQGMWQDDLEDGFGQMVYANGVRFVGQFRKGQRKGPGVQTECDGRVTVGRWRGLGRGGGAHIDTDGTFYQCEWADGRLTGDVTRIKPDGAIATNPSADDQDAAQP